MGQLEQLENIFRIPSPASQIAGQVDAVFLFILVIGVFFFVVTQGTLIYFAVKYRRKKGEADKETPYITQNTVLEVVWILVPALLLVAIFAYGYAVFAKMHEPMPGAMEINVTARQWLWEFQYPDGKKTVNELKVPVNEPVKLVMTSADVIHSLFIPEFRIKQDILPGRYTYIFIKPEKTGMYQIFCAEYCGNGHSTMLAGFEVMDEHEYEEWAAGMPEEAEAGKAPADRGEELAKGSGCLSCHSTDGKPGVGPTFKGLFGKTVMLQDGSSVKADEDYIRESIIDPKAKVAKGYQPIMPTFKETLSASDITYIISYIKKLSGIEAAEPPAPPVEKEAGPSVIRGRELVESAGCLSCHTVDGRRLVGPTFKGLYGSRAELEGGGTAMVDEKYVRESVLEPSLKIVKGFDNLMPSFKGVLSEGDIASITDYLKSIGAEDARPAP